MKEKYEYIVFHVNFFIASRNSAGNSYRIGNGVKIDIQKLFKEIDNKYYGIDF